MKVKDVSDLRNKVGSNGLVDAIRRNEKVVRLQQTGPAKSESTLPPIRPARQLVENILALPDEVIHGLLHQGSKMVLGGGSKSYKTWCLIDLALSVANGVDWWNMKTTRGRALYINFEIQNAFFAHRVSKISEAKGMAMDALDNLDVWNLRGHCTDLSTLMNDLMQQIQKGHYSLIIADPIYKGLGNRDENAAGDINSLLNEIEKLAVQTGAAVVFGAHFSKGNQAAKESIDRISGSGVFARDPDTILVMTKHDNEDTYTVEPTSRNFPALDPFCVRWIYPLMERDEKADPTKLKQPGTRKPKYNSDQLLDVLADQECSTRDWCLKTGHKTGMSKRTFMDKLSEIKNDETKLLKTKDGNWKAVNPVKKQISAEVQQVQFAPSALIAPNAAKLVQQQHTLGAAAPTAQAA